MHRRTTLVLAAVFLAVASTSEASILDSILPSPSVTTEYDHSVPLANRTYSWGDLQMAVPQYAGVVRTAIDANLKKRGWQLVASGGSATVFAHGDIRGEEQLQSLYIGPKTGANAPLGEPAGTSQAPGTWGQPWGQQGWGAGWKPLYGEATFNALNVPENNLVVDIFDTGNHRLIFRGVLQDDLSGTEKKTDKQLSKTIKRMFKKFPPKK